MSRNCLTILAAGLLAFSISYCSSSKVPVSDICEKMLECDTDGETTLEECEEEMKALAEVIRTSSWNALADCLLEMTCEELQQEDGGIMLCMEAAGEAAPAGAGDPFLRAYCQRAVDCGQYPGSVDDCVSFAKEQAGDYLGMFNMFNDRLINCLKNCTADLSCDDLNYFYEICGLACEIPFVEIDLDCDRGYQDDDVCVCDQGWAGELCDECAEGYISDGWDCVGYCQPDTCSGHGLCEDSYGYLYCTCDTGYTGEFCESCAEGYLEVEGRCRPVAGCTNDGDACDDGLVCTTDDVCGQGVCLGTDLDCNDGVACTLDSCLDVSGGCYHEPQPTGEPEGYLGDPICENGLDDDCDELTDLDDPDCLTLPCTTAADCPDDGNSCTESVCEQSLCYWPALPDASPCPGSNECSSSFICRGSNCLPDYPDLDGDQDGFADEQCGTSFDCDDSDPLVHPGAEGPLDDPSCTDGLDNDCDGLIDPFDQSCWAMYCSPEGWCLEHPRIGTNDLQSIWAPAADDVWVSGEYEWLLHWDGTALTRVEHTSYWGFNDMCGCAPDNGWAAGRTGDIMHYDGLDWVQVPAPNEPHILHGIWCKCEGAVLTEAWAAGRPGYILHYDGAQWTLDPFQAPEDFYDIWATGAGEAWAVGRNGYMAYHDGSAWQPVASGTSEDLQGIWGRSPTEIWAVGSGVILFNDGTGWTAQTVSASFDFVWGLENGPGPWAAGGSWSGGSVLEYLEGVWQGTNRFGNDPPALYALGGTSENDLWGVGYGGTIIHSDGVQALNLTPGIGFSTGICATEFPDGRVRAWAFGRYQDEILEYDGAEWQVTQTHWNGWVETAWCAGVHGIWLMDDDGEYLRFGASLDETGMTGDLPTAEYLRALHGRIHQGMIEMWAVGDRGLAVHFDGSTWIEEHAGSGWNDLEGVWVEPQPSTPDVFAVGESGLLYTRDDSGWKRHEDITSEDLNAVWGDGQGTVWVVGQNGTALKWNGATFVTEPMPVDIGDLSDVQGTGPDDVWILGDETVMHWDGELWTLEPAERNNDGRLAVTASHVWIINYEGAIYHKNR